MSGLIETGGFFVFLSVAFKSTAVLGAAWLISLLLRTRSAALRHLVWTAAAMAVLALPFLSASLPTLSVSPAAFLPASSVAAFNTTASDRQAAASSESAAKPSAAVRSQPVATRVNWRLLLMAVWAAGALAMLIHMAVACLLASLLRRSAQPWADAPLTRELCTLLGIEHPVEVLETESSTMPMAFGLLRSTVFMPAGSSEWSEERRRIVLLHELAHIRRGDFVTHLLARTALAMHWWNPLAWYGWREFLKESERATDDLVLNAGTCASDYAGHLVAVARSLHLQPVGFGAVAMVRPSQLENRVRAILDARVNRKTQSRASAVVAVLAGLGIVAPLAAVRAQQRPASTQNAGVDVDAAIRSARVQKNYEILEKTALATEQLRDFAAAQKLLEAALAMRAELDGKPSAEYGLGLVKLADFENRRHHSKAAAPFYAEAVQMLGDRPEAGHALIQLGVGAIVAKDVPTALQQFEHAQRVDPAHSGQALMWMAIARQAEGNTDEAATLFKSALSVQDAESAEAVITMKSYAHFLKQQQQLEEADQLEAKANAAQKTNAIAAPPKSSLPAGVYRIGAGVGAPSLTQKIEPEYTDEARAAKLTGTVALYIEIGPDGVARNARVLRGLGLGLDENAIDAVAQWHFKPATKDGEPVAVMATVEVNWKLM